MAFSKLADENLACSLSVLFDTCIDSCIFPISMKMADICPVYKKLDYLCKDNYLSVNLLTVFSKLFERIMAEQLTAHFENMLSPSVSAQREKCYSWQHVIMQLTEYWRKALDENKYVGTLAMDLSKAFDCIPHGLLLAKLHSYELPLKACMFIVEGKSRSKNASVCLSVRLSHLFHVPLIMKFSGYITIDKSDVYAKGQGQRSRSQRSK